MEPTKELLDVLERDKLAVAVRMDPDDKLFAGACLFDSACQITLAGIRAQIPEVDEEGALRILRERLAMARRMEYRP